MSEKILACPYCGSDSTKVSDFYGSWCGTCLDCEATGPAALDINDAVLLWNAAANALEQKDAEIARLVEACDDLQGEYLRMKDERDEARRVARAWYQTAQELKKELEDDEEDDVLIDFAKSKEYYIATYTARKDKERV